jgi:hypothetical protein
MFWRKVAGRIEDDLSESGIYLRETVFSAFTGLVRHGIADTQEGALTLHP